MRREYDDRDGRHDRDGSDRRRDDRAGRHDRDMDREGRHARDKDSHRRHEGNDRLRDTDRDRENDKDRHRDRARDRQERVRDRSRERSRERLTSRDSDGDRGRDSRAPGRDGHSRPLPREEEAGPQKRSRSQDPGHAANGFADEDANAKKRQKTVEPDLPPPPPAAPAEVDFDADISAEEMQMMSMMGIPFGFDTTQGKHVDDEASNAGQVKTKEKRRGRQYMNRRGGFNRPLPAERTGETARRD